MIEIPSHPENDIRLDLLEEKVREDLREGRRIAAFIATMGTTDTFGIDDLEAMVRLRDSVVKEFQLDYRPDIHADAVIGWAWSVFNDYGFEANPLGFRPLTARALANFLLLGKTGMRVLLGHMVEMSDLLREHLEGHHMTTVLNGANFWTVRSFASSPTGWTPGLSGTGSEPIRRRETSSLPTTSITAESFTTCATRR